MRVTHVVSAIVRSGQHILMVQQPDDDENLYWFIPGGVVEAGELITDALRREVAEESGLVITDEMRLAFVTQINIAQADRQTFAFVFDTTAFEGVLMPADPDELTHQAVFVPIDEAIARLAHVQWMPMRDPLVAYLRGDCEAGAVWQYQQHSDETFTEVHRTS